MNTDTNFTNTTNMQNITHDSSEQNTYVPQVDDEVAASAPLSWELLPRLTPEQYRARQKEIRRWILENPPRRNWLP